MSVTIEKYIFTLRNRNFEYSLGQEVSLPFAPGERLWIYSISENPGKRETELELQNGPPIMGGYTRY